MKRHPVNNEFQPFDAFKAWNSVFAGDPCKHRFLKLAPGQLYLYDPPDGQPTPPYRFPPNSTFPDRLVTNQMGWRGPPIEVPRGPRTIRIVFVGSSTVIEGHFVPYSYPEFVGYWLNLWAQAKKLDVRFEVLNSARESNVSTDLAAIVKTEVLPLHPDLVVYYEGGNQFQPESIVEKVPEGKAVRPPGSGASVSPEWLRTASRWSALLGRVQAAIGLAASDMDGKEWPKPDYKVVWPPGLDEQNPDLAYPNLPVSLNVIQRDLDAIRADLATIGSDFALSLLRLDGEGRSGARPDPPPLHPRAAQRLELPVSAIATSSGWRSSRTGCSPNTRRRTASPSSTSRASCRSIPTCSSTPSIPATPARACAAGSRSTRSSR